MDLVIAQNCPSCGAAIDLKEDDRVIRCGFCDVNNYKVEPAAQRFTLPCKHPDSVAPEEMIFAPYLRFKGSIYYIRGDKLKYKIIDTTRAGIANSSVPVSLGLRPQAMVLQPVVASTQGSFIKQSVATREVFGHAAAVAELFTDDSRESIYYRGFIGETLSRIYQPYYMDGDRVIDAVTGRDTGDKQMIDGHLAATRSSDKSWEPRFISMICPGCGGLLEGEGDSVALHCSNCERLWQEIDGTFHPVSWQVVTGTGRQTSYLPVWRLCIRTTGYPLRSYGDYLRFTNQPVVMNAEFDNIPFAICVPAFKLNPKAFLQLASQLTIGIGKIPSGQVRRVDVVHSANLHHKEAIEASKAILAATCLSRKQSYPLLPKMKVQVDRCELVYLPFQRQIHDLVQEHTGATVQTAALRYGRML